MFHCQKNQLFFENKNVKFLVKTISLRPENLKFISDL